MPPGTFSGTDFDGGTVDKIKITSFPTNANSITIDGTNYTIDNFPSGGVIVTAPAGIPTPVIEIDPIDGAVTVVIPYKTIDNAGTESKDPGTASVPFTTVKVSGIVFNDPDKGPVNGSSSDPIPSGIFATLYSSQGIVIASVPVNSTTGSYEITDVNGGAYGVIIGTTQQAPGAAISPPDVPTGWKSTGESNEPEPGTPDTAIDTQSEPFTIVDADVENINFGIKLLVPPTATNNFKLSNPAGPVTQQIVTEDDGLGVDSDPDGTLDPTSIDLDPSTADLQTTLTVPGEGIWTVVDNLGNVKFTPEVGFTKDPTDITYTIKDDDGLVSNVATIYVDYVPVAKDDEKLNQPPGAVSVPILANDTDGDTPVPTSVKITGTTNPGDPLDVPTEGIWTVTPTGITFTPNPGFTGDPTPIEYTVSDNDGNPSTANVTITYANQPPVATNNEKLSNPAGPVTQQIVTEDDLFGVDSDPDGTLDLTSIDLDPSSPGTQETTLTVPGEGTWTVDDNLGNVKFTPEVGFTEDPTDITYTIKDDEGLVSNTASIKVDYVPVAKDDEKLNQPPGAVSVPILANDTDGDTPEPTSVKITGTTNPGDPLDVPTEGIWTVTPTGITFTPNPGFTGDPTPIEYTVSDNDGNPTTANVTITYGNQPPVATNNEKLSNPAGPVTQQIVTEDDLFGVDSDPDGTLDLTSIDLDPSSPSTQETTLTVPGEGTWTVDDNLGNVKFTPEVGFTEDPTDITYTIKDDEGLVSNTASIKVDYVPVAKDDEKLNQPPGAVSVPILANDTDGDTPEPTSVKITGTTNPGDPLDVPTEGIWTVTPTGITFTPNPGFTGDPTPIEYTVSDNDGNSSTAFVKITYSCVMEISGTVFLDTDGPVGVNSATGFGIDGTTIGTGLYMTLMEGATQKGVQPISGTGTYKFTNVAAGTYSLVLSTTAAGSSTPSLPNTHVFVSEGGNLISGVAQGDGTADGKTTITADCNAIIRGVNLRPNAAASYANNDFGIKLNPSALPVDLLDFYANQIEDQVNLTWKVANEKEFSHFEVQKSVDGKEFGSIGIVQGTNANLYNAIDSNPSESINYYRLKMFDLDGKTKLSKIISQYFEKGQNFVSVENPVQNGEIKVLSNLKNPRFTLLNSLGAKIKTNTTEFGNNKFSILTGNSPAGMYYLNIESEGKIQTRKVLIP